MNLGQKYIYIYFYIVTWHALKDLFFESSLNNKKPFISASDGLRLKKKYYNKMSGTIMFTPKPFGI